MELTQTELILHTRKRDAIRWPYLCLRRYGYDSNLFSFESGRRCQTGQGEQHLLCFSDRAGESWWSCYIFNTYIYLLFTTSFCFKHGCGFTFTWRLFFTEDILTHHSSKTIGVNDKMSEAWFLYMHISEHTADRVKWIPPPRPYSPLLYLVIDTSHLNMPVQQDTRIIPGVINENVESCNVKKNFLHLQQKIMGCILQCPSSIHVLFKSVQ